LNKREREVLRQQLRKQGRSGPPDAP
jgi:hypothetical protein